MNQFAGIGLNYFGKNVLDELLALNVDALLIDEDREVVDSCRDSPLSAAGLDVLAEESLRRALPETIDPVGATKIVLPNREAAKRIAPLMLAPAGSQA